MPPTTGGDDRRARGRGRGPARNWLALWPRPGLATVVEKVAELGPQLRRQQADRAAHVRSVWLVEVLAIDEIEREQDSTDPVTGEHDLIGKLHDRSLTRHGRDHRTGVAVWSATARMRPPRTVRARW